MDRSGQGDLVNGGGFRFVTIHRSRRGPWSNWLDRVQDGNDWEEWEPRGRRIAELVRRRPDHRGVGISRERTRARQRTDSLERLGAGIVSRRKMPAKLKRLCVVVIDGATTRLLMSIGTFWMDNGAPPRIVDADPIDACARAVPLAAITPNIGHGANS